jgi:UDP-N-acetylmuramoyl-tripeptide--D-alanyl-D-alanine ligase
VNDGSTDRTAQLLDEMAAAHPEFKVVHFRRNFGQTAAMQAGFDFASGDIIVPMDADLQNDPDDLSGNGIQIAPPPTSSTLSGSSPSPFEMGSSLPVAMRSAFTRVRDGLAWRFRKLVGNARVDRAAMKLAKHWRPMLKKPVFIGILGSAGKTTTKQLLMEALARSRRGVGTPGNFNRPPVLAETILRLRPTHDYCVAELNEGTVGELEAGLSLLRPDVGIVTNVGTDHWSLYGSREAIAMEMGKLIRSLPPSGTAVLNADDDLVRAMAANCVAKVITYGMAPDADLRAEDASSVWPQRLEMTLVRGTERVRLRTELCGLHWIPSVLGAIGGALAVGMSLQECAEAIAGVAPVDGRMQPVTTPEGVTFIRDDFKAPLWTIDASFEFMKAARAKRKIIVVGTLSDVGSGTGAAKKSADVARRAQQIADITVFVGPWASSALKTRAPGREDSLRAFNHVRDAAAYVNSITREGDLVLLKGTNKQNHMVRIIMARTNAIACWRNDCARTSFCNECNDRDKPSGAPPMALRKDDPEVATAAPSSGDCIVASGEQVIVALGNPEPKLAGTPHNLGHAVVDRLAESLGLAWETRPEAWIARGSSRGASVCLIKIRTAMNNTGIGLKQLAEKMSFGPGQCILVHDDLDLPIGSVRTRLSGGAGGHHGVASILEAFQTDGFRRVKVGVGQPGAKSNPGAYVLTPFDAASRAAIDPAIVIAGTRALEFVASDAKSSA